MKKSEKKTFLKGVSSVFDLHGRPLNKRHTSEDNLHATWYNVGVFLTRGMERVEKEKKLQPGKNFRKLSTF
tara:strand:+ start:556 stop:768 length:213 start_codon:yes stop_codon:yes gene_type:complete